MRKDFVELQKLVTDGTQTLYDLFQVGRVRPSICVAGICPDGECGICIAEMTALEN